MKMANVWDLFQNNTGMGENRWGYGCKVGHELIIIDAGWYIPPFYMFEIFHHVFLKKG